MSTSLFVGCSLTSGVGFELEADDPSLWVNMLHAQTPALSSTELINYGEGGASNNNVFYNAVNGLVKHQPKYAFVQWTSAPRYNVSLGLETYSTRQFFGHNIKSIDCNLHNVTYPASYLANVGNRFLSLHHPYADILTIVKYINTLNTLTKITGTRIFFINGLCPWDNQFFNKLENVLPSDFTKYTQRILESETRSDEESFTLYNKIHNEFAQAGGIQESQWLNLYNSFGSNKIDTNNDNIHPGIKSNQLYVDILTQSLTQSL